MQRGPDAQSEPSPTRWLGNRVWLVPRSNRPGPLGRVLDNLLGIVGDLMIVALAIRGRYDVVQVRDKSFAGLVGWLAARLSGARFVYWMSYPFAESKLYQAENRLVPHHRLVWLKGHLVRLMLYRVVLPLADFVFVQSERMKDDVAAEGVDRGKMASVPMGIRGDEVGGPADARAPDPGNPRLLHLGIILKLRQSEMLVRVLYRVRERFPNAMLDYVGEGQMPTDRQAVEDEARRLGLSEAVRITGQLPMEDAWARVREADICFSPFCPIPILLSTSPTKLVEYMAMAKCIVANEHPEQSVILADSGVGRAIPWDEQAFADEVCRLLEDPEQARAMAARGPDWVRERRTYQVIADGVEARYRTLLDDPEASGRSAAG